MAELKINGAIAPNSNGASMAPSSNTSNSVEQASMEQPVQPCCVDNAESDNEDRSSDSQVENAAANKKGGKKKADNKPTSRYTPEVLTDMQQKAIIVKEILDDLSQEERYALKMVADGRAYVNMKEAYENGLRFFKTKGNRLHGSDLKKTGSSLLRDGAQQALVVIPVAIAKEVGIEYECFPSDNDQDLQRDGYIIIEGHGRMEFVLDFLKSNLESDFPEMDAVTLRMNAEGVFDPAEAMEVINSNVSKWKCGDFITKKLVNNSCSHEGWAFIKDLQDKGYNYQASCQLATLKNDRVKQSEILKGDENVIFENFDHAKKLYEAYVGKFGSSSEALKTKAFTMELSKIWHGWENFGKSYATKQMIAFISSLNADDVNSINVAKKTSDQTKDDVRLSLVNKLFNKFKTQRNG